MNADKAHVVTQTRDRYYYELAAEAYAADLAAAGSHTGVALGRGPLRCATCAVAWPCKTARSYSTGNR